jgi:hypothetical protein
MTLNELTESVFLERERLNRTCPLHQNLPLEHLPYYGSGSVQKSGAPCKSPKSLAWEQGPALRIGTQLENLHLELA